MKSNPSIWVVAGSVGLAAIAGITYAVVQPSSQEPAAISSPAPAAIVQSPATIVQSPAASPSAVTSSPRPAVTTPPALNSAPKPASAATRTVETCETRMAIVDDPNPPLNVRAAPSTAGDNIVGQLKNGTVVTVSDEQNGWLQITTPTPGWISKQQTNSGCNLKVERVGFASNATSIEIADRFIGTGTHQYLFNAREGQTITIRRQQGPLPLIVAPNGKAISEFKDTQQTRWTGTLPRSGDYSVQLESNYRGYSYAFSIEID